MKAILYKTALSGILAAALTLTSSAAPKMILSEESFEFGTVPQAASVTHVFWLKSVGDETLKVLQVVPGCGCTKAPLEKTEIAAGDSTRLEIVFNTGRYHKHVVKSPRIETNEKNPHRKITFSANVVAPQDNSYPLKIIPRALDISASDGSVSNTTRFVIRNVTEEDISLTLVDQPEGMFDIELPETVKAGQGVKVVVTIRPAAAITSLKNSFTIAAGGNEPVRYTIPVVHTVSSLGGR